MERHRNNSHQFESIRALITQIHHGSTSNIFYHHSNEELSSTNEMERSTSDRSVNSLNTLPFLSVEKPRKRSMFEGAFKIPLLTVTGPQSADSPDEGHLPRRFSFGNFRRHSHGSGLNRVDSMGSLAHRTLTTFIENDDFGNFKSFLDAHQIQVDDRDENGTTVLMTCSSKGLTHYVRELISHGSDVNLQDLDNWTALLCAAKGGHYEIVETLLDNGADIEHRDMGNWTALMWATYKGHVNIVQFLLERNADINANGNYHISPLLWACGRGYTEIVQMLVQRGAKVNVGDKYGTTALVWACRKGNAEIVDILLKANANVDTAGMYSWTALLVAASAGHQDCVALLLERKPNVNAIDKDGQTALAIACKEGFQEIASALISAGAYLNSQDRNGDTPLIGAVKIGHRGIVEALLKRHVDIDLQGKDKKTALYTAVEKGHVTIVKLLLSTNPDIELSNKDSETPLSRAVRNRNLEIVNMLLEKRAKVGAVDRRGDTCLHIAMRARSKAIVEALLRNPKNSQLLYRANKVGETPYALDALHQKTILGQVFGARKLNTHEDAEGMLGYGLYSSALADVLSEPTLTTPITVGLFAKWGSGKSFLLTKLREEMTCFSRQWSEPQIKATWIIVLISIHLALFLGIIVALSTLSVIYGVVTGSSLLILMYSLSLLLKFINRRYNFDWSYNLHHSFVKKIGKFRLILQVAFCHPAGSLHSTQTSAIQTMPVRFHFAEMNGAAPTGETALGYMLSSLFTAIENYYGSVPTRLYRSFRPKPLKPSSNWRFRKMCCIPIFLLFEIFIFASIAGIALLIMWFINTDSETKKTIEISLYVIAGILIAGAFFNLNAWAKALNTIFFSQGRFLKQIMKSNDGLTALSGEVMMMADMVRCLDSFTGQQSRLVGVIDTLDVVDIDRILSLLNGIQTLLMTPNRPFVLLLAVDPHVVAKSVEQNSKRLFSEGGIGGHDFLRNLVHLPVYLQNSGLRKVQKAQSTAMQYKRIISDAYDDPNIGISYSASNRRLSNASEIMASTEKLRGISRGSKKLKLSESIASSIGSNMHKIGGGQFEFSKVMLTDDYFSDVNPRSMRRLMNVIYITVRLLKAFQIDFSWYRLGSWINLTEQWPLRASMIILEDDLNGDNLDEMASLQSVYEKVRPKLSCLREAAPLLDLDRDERKLDAFLQLHKADLQVSDLRIFLPFTINLDPYLRKVLKEDQQAMEEDEGIVVPLMKSNPSATPQMPNVYNRSHNSYYSQQNPFIPPVYSTSLNSTPMALMNYFNATHRQPLPTHLEHPILENAYVQQQQPQQQLNVDMDISQIKLSKLSCDDLIQLLGQINELKGTMESLSVNLKENAITGKVLMYCDLNELKVVLGLNFGHWETFKYFIMSLRDGENASTATKSSIVTFKSDTKDVCDGASVQVPQLSRTKQKSVIEKQNRTNYHHDNDLLQVTLEQEMISGALSTLNEEAFEDVTSNQNPMSSNGSTGRQSSMMKSDRLYSMGSSFDDRSDDESSYEFKVPVSRNNSSKNLAVESIPLVSK
ncbi:kinase D-interacting substrate of 220 kDa isoform X3 [Chironomus tepperi]|uniref:kinase D-interacting substrate of 220 kDa isoform X3 n=1 Tax=Chironomus tepperi TaxID=113505 RepID=UPI00391F9830